MGSGNHRLVYDAVLRLAVKLFKSKPNPKELYGRPDLSGCREIALPLLGVGIVAVSIVLYVAIPRARALFGILIAFVAFLLIGRVMGAIANDLTADHSRGVRGVFIRLIPSIIACSFLIGLLCARPNVEASDLAIFRVEPEAKPASQYPIQGQIVYVLSKFVIVFRPGWPTRQSTKTN